MGVDNVGLLPFQDPGKRPDGGRGEGALCNAVHLNIRHIQGSDLRDQQASPGQDHGNGKTAAVVMAQVVYKASPRAADVAVGDDMEDPGHAASSCLPIRVKRTPRPSMPKNNSTIR